MTILKHRPHRDEFPELRAKLEAEPLHRPAPFRPAYPGVSADALRELRADGEPSPADRAALDRLAGPTRGIRTAWLRPVPLANIPTLEDLAAKTHDAVTGAHRMLDDLAAYATEIRELLAGVAR